jgi:hypothetical protein
VLIPLGAPLRGFGVAQLASNGVGNEGRYGDTLGHGLGVESQPQRGGERNGARNVDVARSAVGENPWLSRAGRSFLGGVFYSSAGGSRFIRALGLATCGDLNPQ